MTKLSDAAHALFILVAAVVLSSTALTLRGPLAVVSLGLIGVFTVFGIIATLGGGDSDE